MGNNSEQYGDVEFFFALRKAARSLDKAHVEMSNQADKGLRDLIDYIRSSAPLGNADRNLLADFLSGTHRREPGRPARSAKESWTRHLIYGDYLDIIEQLQGSLSNQAASSAAYDFLSTKYPKYSRQQLEQIVRNPAMRFSQTGSARKKTPG